MTTLSVRSLIFSIERSKRQAVSRKSKHINNQTLKYSLLFALLGALFYIPFNGGVHLFDWDEINFAEISREMMILEDYLRVHVDFKPFWEKPPFFFWMQVLAMRLFGVGEFAARLPNAICGVATLVMLYNMGKKLYDHRFGVIWAGVYFGTMLPFLYFKSGIIDPIFNLFIFLGLYFFILFYWKKEGEEGIVLNRNKWLYLFLGGFFIGLAILTKGQAAFLIAALTMFVYWIYQRFRFYISVPQFLFFTFSATLVTLAWYGLETMKNGTWFIEEFNKYQYRLFSTPDAGHRGFPGYHFAVLLIGCFPASIFAIRSFFKMQKEEQNYQKDFKIWIKFLFWVVLILFTIVKSKIVHYSSMCYFPLTFLAALVIQHMVTGKITLNGWMKGGLIAIASLFLAAVILVPIIGQNTDLIRPLLSKDPFAQGNLDAKVNWHWSDWLPAVYFLALMILVFFWFQKKQFQKAFIALFGGTAVFTFLILIFFIAKIEAFSQRAAIEFFESKQGVDAYVIPHGYKSYGHLFYTRKPQVTNKKSYDKLWLLEGDIDKDVYVVTKVHKAHELQKYPELEEINRKNGFVFFVRRSEN